MRASGDCAPLGDVPDVGPPACPRGGSESYLGRLAGLGKLHLGHNGPVPPYMRLAELIRGDIAAGRLKPGDRLPSISQLADDHGLSPGTVQKALRILKDEELIMGSPGYGVFVAER